VFIGFHLLGFFGFGGTFGLAGGVAMLALAPDYFQPLRDFAAAYHDRANALALDDRAAGTFLPEIARMSMPRARKATDGPPPAIRVRDLTVRLPGQTCPVLDGVALDVPAGGLAAVAGPSGIGKSLLVACVGGLVEDMAGTATVGGRTADDAARPALCWLGQEPLIRHGSVLANLSPDGRPVAHDAAWRALAEVGLAPVVARMPRGLLTPLGETGAGLSRGELRRVAVARALLDPAPVLLADEPTADLDADSAAIVRRVLAGMAGARTVLVATHDDDLAAMAGHVLRLGGVR
jgi:ATP-binding cassette subfamily C protein CydD